MLPISQMGRDRATVGLCIQFINFCRARNSFRKRGNLYNSANLTMIVRSMVLTEKKRSPAMSQNDPDRIRENYEVWDL